jgi:molybdopterin-binding protein
MNHIKSNHNTVSHRAKLVQIEIMRDPLGDTIHMDLAKGGHMALLTVRAAAERLGVGYSTLKRWIGTGRVRTSRTEGGHHRIAEAEIDRLTARQQPERPAARIAPPGPDETIVGLSARNRLHGFIEEVRVDGLLAQIRLRVGNQTITAVITADAVRALKFRRGDDAIAIVKSTEVMIARANDDRPRRTRRR